MDLDFNAMLQQIADPRQGLPVIGVLVLLNALFGALVARRKGEFDRLYLLNFVESRLLYQGLPVGLVGFVALFYEMPLLSFVYVTCAAVMTGDLLVDLREKMSDLFPKK